MKISAESLLLYAVTDRAWSDEQNTLYSQVEQALEGGVTCVQLREKQMDDDDFLREAIEIKQLCKKYNTPFIVNDNVTVAVACSADGIHVGQSDMQAENVREIIGDRMILGVSAQTVEQAVEAERHGADYIGVGAVFSTATKPDAVEVSFDTLKKICHAVSIPVVAIGGINKKNLENLKNSGIDGVALVSAIFARDNIKEECKELKKLARRTVGL